MTTKTTWDLTEAVELLDRTQPDLGWVFDVRVGQLDLRKTCSCVLGQLAGSYYSGLSELGIDFDEGIRLGLDIGPNDDKTYARLTKAWRRELNELREDPRRIMAYAVRSRP